MLLAAHEEALWGVWFEGQAHIPDIYGWTEASTSSVLKSATQQINAYFAGNKMPLDLPINTSLGTPFQQQVWQSIAKIPFGTTCTYSHIAQDIGKHKAVRAVANAIARNRWMIVLPCHRVVGSQGQLTGYAAGLERKSALLQFESRT
jgi:methylated-DNA-[protein]-cysteine S-methyltransferase